MNWETILSLFPWSKDTKRSGAKALLELRVRLRALIDLASSYLKLEEAPSDDFKRSAKQQLDEIKERFVVSGAEVAAAAPGSLKRQWVEWTQDTIGLANELEATIVGTSKSPAVHIRTNLHDALRRLELLAAKYERSLAVWRQPRRLVYFAIGLLTVLSALYLRFSTGMSVESAEVIFPRSIALEGNAQGQLSAYPADIDDFMMEFSKFYFHRPSKFRERYLLPGANTKPSESAATETSVELKPPGELLPDEPYEWVHNGRFANRYKIVLHNNAHFGTTFISSVSADVMLKTPKPFPWYKLQVAPALRIDLQWGPGDLSELALKNDGIGPAVDVSWSLSAHSGLQLKAGHLSFVMDCASISLPSSGDDVSPWPVTRDETVELGPRDEGLKAGFARELGANDRHRMHLEKPLFFRLTKKPDQRPVKDKFFEFSGQWYETITELERLTEITEVAWNEPCDVTAHYSGIDDVAKTLICTIDLPTDSAFYGRKETLLEHDPRSVRIAPYRVEHMVPEAHIVLEAFAKMFTPTYEPKGVDIITCEVELDVSTAAIGENVNTILPVDRFLNPGGSITIYATCLGCRNGRYQLSSAVNGHEEYTVDVDVLVPDRWSFPQNDDERKRDIERLQNCFVNRNNQELPK